MDMASKLTLGPLPGAVVHHVLPILGSNPNSTLSVAINKHLMHLQPSTKEFLI